MRTIVPCLLGALALAACATPRGGYAHGNQVYETRSECLAAKNRSKGRGAIAGAIGGAATGVVLDGNLGEVALASGLGAVAGAAIGSNVKQC